MNKQRKTAWIILMALAIAIKIFSLFPIWIERYYSHGIYPYISGLQRLVLGWIPFSIGDLLYLLAGVFLVKSLYVFIVRLIKKQVNREAFVRILKNIVFVMLWIYVLFNLLWGLNYNRLPMAQRFGLKMDAYSTAELAELVWIMGGRLNALDSAGIKGTEVLRTKKTIFEEAADTYRNAEHPYTELAYHPSSIKPSLFSYLGNYLGFSGYYNPFSGEAQVNTTVPSFLQPFVACHEIGHQLGYAKEDEANFSGFLSARSSGNDAFLYSVYFDMYAYARRELYYRDSTQMKLLYTQLRPRIRNDFTELKRFYQRYENPFEPLIRKLYAGYLKANQQPKGMASYNEVVAMLISYYRQQGLLKADNTAR